MRYLFLLIGCIYCISADAQFKLGRKKETQQAGKVRREDYIKDHPDHFFIWPVLKQRSQNYELQINKPEKRTIGYYSNKPYSFGLGFYLFELSAEITFAIPLNEKSKRIYGESKSSNLQLNLLGKRWGIDTYFQRYEGFYLKDSRVVIPSNTPFIQRPDIRTQNIGLNINYTFNYKKFSFRAAYNFSERQLKSAGSFLLFGTVDNFRIAGDSALLGSKYEESFLRSSKVKEINSVVFGVAPGYTYTMIYQGFFINGTLGIGPALNWSHYYLDDHSSDKSTNLNALIGVKLSLGYNGDRFFGGMTFSNQSASAKFDNVNITSSVGSFKILAGYRILERGILKKRAKDLEKTILR